MKGSLVQWSLLLRWVTLLGCLCSMSGAESSLGIRQRSVESCGPHPLIALAAASRPFATSPSSLNDLLRAVRGDRASWSEMQILLRRYDDCTRAGDGLHYKRGLDYTRSNNFPSGRDKDQSDWQQQQQKQEQFSFSGMMHSPPRSIPLEESVVGSVPEF